MSYQFMGQTVGALACTPPRTAPTFSGAMGGISMGMSIGSAIGSVYSAWSMGKTLKYQLETQAKIDQINARMQRLGAEAAHRQGEGEVAQITMRAGKIRSAQTVAYGANGVAVDFGSAAEERASTQIMKEIDVQTANLNTLARVWGYKQEAYNRMSDSYAHMAEGAIKQGAQNAMAISTLAGSVGDIHERWQRFQGGR